MLIRNILLCVLLLSSAGINADAAISNRDFEKIVAGDKTLELVQTRQLTTRKDGVVDHVYISPNGKYLAYYAITPNLDSPGRIIQLYLCKSTGGKSVMLFEGGGQYNSLFIGDNSEWNVDLAVNWSPDSSLFVVRVWRKVPANPTDDTKDIAAKETIEDNLLVFDTKGGKPTVFTCPGTGYLFPRWNPDSRRLMTSYSSPSEPGSDITYNVVVLNTKTGQAETVCKRSCRHLWVQGWDATGEAIICNESRKNLPSQNLKIHLNGRPTEESEGLPNTDFYRRSGDGWGAFRLSTKGGENTATIENVATGAVVSTLTWPKDDTFSLGLWVPHSNLLTYTMDQPIQDIVSSKTSKTRTMWLFYPGGGKFDRICVAFNADPQASWSNDGIKVAYTSSGCIYVADLEWRQATLREKAAAGGRLTEDETKELMMENARQIADAIRGYTFNAESLPPQDRFFDIMNSHLRDKDALMMPGTDKNACTYNQPDKIYPSQLESRKDTVLVTLDAGCQWEIRVFADWHVALVDK